MHQRQKKCNFINIYVENKKKNLINMTEKMSLFFEAVGEFSIKVV